MVCACLRGALPSIVYVLCACMHQFLMCIMLSPQPVYIFVSSLANHVTEMEEKEAKARISAGKCEHHLSWCFCHGVSITLVLHNNCNSTWTSLATCQPTKESHCETCSGWGIHKPLLAGVFFSFQVWHSLWKCKLCYSWIQSASVFNTLNVI